MLALLVTLFASASAMTSQEYHPAVDQATLLEIRKNSPYIMSISSGAPVPYSEANSSLNADLIRHPFFMDLMTHQTRERVNSRCVHEKGTGAFGQFTPTNDLMSSISKADFFKPGKVTPVAVRFSPATGYRGSPELVLGMKGIAFRFYTEQGNYDLLCLNVPMFFTNNPMNFVKVAEILKKKPSEYLPSPMAPLKIIAEYPDSLNAFMTVFSGYGMPATYRHMPAYSVHTMQFENSDGVISFGKMTILPNEGVKNIPVAEGQQISITNPDFYTGDLQTAINNKQFPSWTVYIQHVTEEKVKSLGAEIIFDPTRTLDKTDFPLQEIGKITLDRNPKNYFAEVEQLSFNPNNLVDGIAGSPDAIFQARAYAYPAAQLYRVGGNAHWIPVNCPTGIPDFKCSSSARIYPKNKGLLKLKYETAYNFDQTQNLYENVFTEDERNVMVQTMATVLSAAPEELRTKVLEICKSAYGPMGDTIEQTIGTMKSTQSR